MKKRLILACAALAVLLPALAAEAPLRAQANGITMATGSDRQRPEMGLQGIAPQPFRVLEQARNPEVLQQVRIQRRVIIRISPSSPDAREQLLSALPRRPSAGNFQEVSHGDCVDVQDIVGVQPTQDNRLLLFMDNRQVLAASLERSCTARAFYSGFYVERNDDGQLCIARDRLQSRAGVSCSIDAITRLVAVAD